MNIRTKVCLPLVGITLTVALMCLLVVARQRIELRETTMQTLVDSKIAQIELMVQTNGLHAMEMAALVSRLPEVEQAYRVAFTGDIEDEASPQSQKGREMLRASFAPMIEGYAAVMGAKPQLHFHFASSRSFVRLWREKQTMRDGKWVDISDDLAFFRQSVNDINAAKTPVWGVEVGSGGLAIRGLAPVVASNGEHLGSVETLVPFNPLMDSLGYGKGESTLLYMNPNKRSIATQLHDTGIYPTVNDHYVLVRGTSTGKIEQLITKEFLDSVNGCSAWYRVEGLLIAGMPVKDCKGEQIGTFVFTMDLTEQQIIISRAGMAILASFLFLLVVPIVVTYFVLGLVVLSPVQEMRRALHSIAEDGTILTQRLKDTAKDEIGRLAKMFNRLMDKVESVMSSIEGYKNLINAVPDPIFGIDKDRKITIANKATELLLKKDFDELCGQFCHDCFCTSACGTGDCPINQLNLDPRTPRTTIIDISTDEKQHFIQPVSEKLYDCHGQNKGYVVVAKDVTSLVLKEREINKLAFYDQLTGLANRSLMVDHVKQAIAASLRSPCLNALFFVDVDDFKSINDTQGHDQGDRLLQQIALRLRSVVREGDTVARFGGDEFVLLLLNLSQDITTAAEQAEAIGKKILKTMRTPLQLDTVHYRCSGSIGLTLFGDKPVSVDELLKQADLAMYLAKERGKNRAVFFDPLLQKAMLERNAMEYDLKDAVLNLSQFTLYHQPQVTYDGKIVGTEALLRWEHPRRGLVMPGDFIPMAEGNGLIVVIGDWVLQMACAQLAAWANDPQMSHLTIAVNVSARQFCEPHFVQSVTEIMQTYGIGPGKLKIELTESQLSANVDEIIGKMNELKKHGITFSLDDFGTGYSSLAFLKRLPLDQVKIDKSFVLDLLDDPNDAAIAGTIMTLAGSLGLEAIAEGVENKEQMAFLLNLGCQRYQGYLFSPPQPVEKFEDYARAGQGSLQNLFAKPQHGANN